MPSNCPLDDGSARRGERPFLFQIFNVAGPTRIRIPATNTRSRSRGTSHHVGSGVRFTGSPNKQIYSQKNPRSDLNSFIPVSNNKHSNVLKTRTNNYSGKKENEHLKGKKKQKRNLKQKLEFESCDFSGTARWRSHILLLHLEEKKMSGGNYM